MANSILFIFFLLPFVVDSLYFNITSFQPDDPSGNIVYHGDAARDEDGTVNFNSAARTSQVGWITYSEEVPIWSRRTGNASDFNTSFSFKIDARNLTSDTHGICFFLAPVGAPLPAYTPSGFLGLFGPNIDYKSSFDLVHIEFDTYSNPGWDPRDVASHVGINNNSLESSNYTSWNASLHSQDIGHARVSYDSVNKNLSVSWGYELTASDDESSSLSYIIDLAKVLPSEVMLGFIAAAGLNTGLWCGHPDKSSRPSIKQAIQVMKLESPLPVNLPLKRPVATYYNSTSSSSPPSVNSSRASITFSSKEVGR
ncbi:BnaAnng20840D [Brassica napus]|uniref:BnaAnng20840D protein n=1 Tax=Brassica napus TaxID=3708 RepID=A0A078JJW5_BRANA|nr:BnaAnng20840D [Brassica napus]